MRWKAGLKYATLLPQRKWQFDSDRVIGQPGKETDLWITDDIIQKSHQGTQFENQEMILFLWKEMEWEGKI